MQNANRSKTGVIFNIQKFSVNDGPGIRTVVFLKGCPLHCRWCSNPESQSTKVQILWDYKKCIHCHHCEEICPKQAITLSNEKVHISPILCDGCKRCEKECPEHALTHEGDTKTVQEVLNIVLQDEAFYEESGGGLTLSGGEFLSQPDFSIELLKAAKEEGLHTACETTGFASTSTFSKAIENIDYILFDVKHWNPQKHKEYTGVDNTILLHNLRCAIENHKTILVRTPVIPGFNDSLEDAQGLANLLKKCGANRVQLLPFHQFGENKYELLQENYFYKDIPALHKEDLEEYKNIFTQNGIEAFF